MNCIIFGSNASGFHGAGAAGMVFRSDRRNNWRGCPIMQAALKEGIGYKGHRAVYGAARGFQEGLYGCSYAIQTIERPGMRRSTHILDIEEQVWDLCYFIEQHPEITFCLTKFGAGLAGYTEDEMKPLWNRILLDENVRWATSGDF